MDKLSVVKENEVYNRVNCSDAGMAQELVEYFTFQVDGYQFMPAYKNGSWDGKIRLYNSMTGLLYAGLNAHLDKFAKTRDYEIEYLYDISAYNLSLLEAKEWVKQQNFTLEPRDYQLDAFVHGVRNRRGVLVSPTASGKSFIIYMLTKWYQKKTLIIVPTTSLVHQMTSDFDDYGFDSDSNVHKIFSGQDKKTNKQVTVTTWQSIYKLPKKWFAQYDVVIGDECHLFKAKSLTSIMTKLESCQYRFGFTGTLDEVHTNKLTLQGLFGTVYQVIKTKELMDQKHLSSFDIKGIVLNYTDEEKKLVRKLNYQDEMDFLVSHTKRNNFITNLACSLEGNTLLLFQYVEKHGKLLYESISKLANGRKVFFVHGAVSGEDREEIRHIVENEDNAIIIGSYGTLSTGINIKKLHNIIFASPSKSKIRNLQSIGRVLRKSDEKTHAILYDIADDLIWKKTRNYTINHFIERIKIYDQEQFDYKIYNVKL
jgi:superfamily II DNA or RNA helicase